MTSCSATSRRRRHWTLANQRKFIAARRTSFKFTLQNARCSREPKGFLSVIGVKSVCSGAVQVERYMLDSEPNRLNGAAHRFASADKMEGIR